MNRCKVVELYQISFFLSKKKRFSSKKNQLLENIIVKTYLGIEIQNVMYVRYKKITIVS